MKPKTCSLLILYVWIGSLGLVLAAIRHQFDFDQASFNQGELSWRSDSFKIILDNESQYDKEHNRIRFDKRYQANISGVLNHSPNYEYYVGLWAYVYKSPYDISWFCFSIRAQFYYAGSSCGAECEAYWCTNIYLPTSGSMGRSQFYFKDNSNNIQTFKLIQVMTGINSGWQYFGFYFHAKNSTGVPDHTSGQHKMIKFDSQAHTSTLQVTTLSSTSSGFSEDSFGFPKLGYRKYGGVKGYEFIGLLSKLTIHDSIPSTNEVSTRADVVAMIDTYSYFWNFVETSNNVWHENRFSNQGYDYQGALSTKYFKNSKPALPPYPSNKGWVLSFVNVLMMTDELNLDSSPQFTLEFEVFPYGAGECFRLKIYESKVQADSLSAYECSFIFSDSTISIQSGSVTNTASSFPIVSRIWNRIYLSWQLINNSNLVEICYYTKVMTCSTCSATTNRKYCHSQDANKFLFNFGEMVVAIESPEIIIRNFKFYKYALNEETIVNDLDVSISILTDIDYNFTQEFWPNYGGSAYTTVPAITNANNACMKYITPSTLCRDLDQNIASNCVGSYSPGPGLSYLFCMEFCGTGILGIDPQVYQCDDGNLINGDGCDSACVIEPNYECTRLSNGTSDCVNLCPNSIQAGIEECDDGNTINGDGCSDQCIIEADYGCIRLSNGTSFCSTGCSDGIKANNEDCDDGNLADGDGCNSSCFLEDNYTCDTTVSPNFCYPTCGDGSRTIGEECDDGNNLSNDGCDYKCKLEASYTCTEAPALGRDVCIADYFSPIITLFSLNAQTGVADIIFNDTMKNSSFIDGDISFTVVGPTGPYSVSWSATYSKDNTLRVKFAVSPPILGGFGESIKIKLVNIGKFVSMHEFALATPFEFAYFYTTLEPSPQAEAAGKGASYSFFLTSGISVGATLLTGGSMELMWSMTNTLQIIYYMGLLKLFFYPDLRSMLQFMSFANFDNPLTEIISGYVTDGISLVPFPERNKFDGSKLSSPNILGNALDKILLIALMLLFALIFYLLHKCMKKHTHCFSRLIRAIDMRLRYESICRFLTELSLILFVYSTLNITFDRESSVASIVGVGLSVILMLVLILTTIYTWIYPIVYFDNIRIYPDHNERHCFLFLNFKKTHLKCYLYYGHFLLRRLGLALVFVCLVDFVEVQCICLVVLCGWIAKYHLIYRPFKSQTINFLSCSNELLLTTFCCILFGFTSNSNPTKIKFFGYVGMGVLATFFLINWCAIFPLKFVDLVKSIAACCSKKEKEVRPKIRRTDSQLASVRQTDNMTSKEMSDAVVIERYYPNRHTSRSEHSMSGHRFEKRHKHNIYFHRNSQIEEQKVRSPRVNHEIMF